jgi:uncharacterized protein YjbI with pentapeptide repeats
VVSSDPTMVRKRTRQVSEVIGNAEPLLLDECKLDLVNLRMSTIENVVFLGCSLRETDFHGAKLRSVRFAKCDLQEADFSQAILEMVDLRTSAVADIRGVGSIRGAIVDGSQLIDLAPLLATELGIRVENPDHET